MAEMTLREKVAQLVEYYEGSPPDIVATVATGWLQLPGRHLQPDCPDRWYVTGYVYGFMQSQLHPQGTNRELQVVWEMGYEDGREDREVWSQDLF